MPTTSAPSLRRPSSGSDLSHAVAPPEGACANCGGSVAAPYCGACGQRDLPHNPSARVLVGELWDTFGTIDGKLVRSVSLLLTRPGALTVEWLRGRRSPYLRPLGVYLTVSGTYFALLATTFRPGELQQRRSAEQVRASAEFRARAERKYAAAAAPKRVLLIGAARFGADPGAGLQAAIPEYPHLMFALVPLFAVMVGAAFRRRGWRYPAHLYFSLHVFAFYFALCVANRAVQVYGTPLVRSLANTALALGTLAYLTVAMRRVYGGRWWATAVRVFAVGVPFYLVGILALAGVAIVTLGTR